MSLYSVDNIKEKLVISLYAKGMSVSDIEEEMREIYEIELSTSAISIITNKVNQAAQEWQNMHEAGIASNRESECRGEYVPGSCTHRPSHHGSQ